MMLLLLQKEMETKMIVQPLKAGQTVLGRVEDHGARWRV